MSATTNVTIDQALRDPKLLGSALGSTDSWATWLVVLKSAFGLKLDRAERRVFASIAGSRKPPEKKVEELWVAAGRGGGKSRISAAIAVFLACFQKHDLDPGEVGYVLVLAGSRDQAQMVFSYVRAFLHQSPILRKLIENVTFGEIRLTNGATIAVHSNSYRLIRGRTLLAVVADEIAFWRDESSAVPDIEVYRAVRPSLARTGGMWVAVSSPYRRGGLLYSKYQDHYDIDDDDVLVVCAPTELLNPTIAAATIAKEIAKDPEAGRSEWLAEFRSDVSALFDDAVIEDSIDYARPLELPPRSGLKYLAFTDASAGRHDSFSLTIGHTLGKRDEASWVGDVVRGTVAPFNPREVSQEYAQLARQYGIHKIVGDAYAGEWVANAFADAGIQYETSKLNKSQLYLEALSSFNRGAVSLPNHDKLLRELRGLERRVHRSGRDSVDHPKHGSDDLANAVCGALYLGMHDVHAPRMSWGTFNPCGNDASVHYHDEEPRQNIRIVRVTEAEALEQKAKGTW